MSATSRYASLHPRQGMATTADEPAIRHKGGYPYTAGALILAAGFPVRIRLGFSVFGSLTLLDIVLAAAMLRLVFGVLANRGRVRLGDARVAILLTIPFLICVASLAWTMDVKATLRGIGIFTEAMVAYWAVTNAFADLATPQLFGRAATLVILLLAGSALSLLQVPGFGPPTGDLVLGSPDHVAFLAAYYARLGNPFYGLSNDFASVLALYVLPLLAWGVVRRKPAYSLLAGVAFAGIVLTLSRGVIAATVAGGILFLIAERQRLTRWLPGIALGFAVVITVGYLYYQLNQAVQTYLLDRFRITTIHARQEILAMGLEKVSDAPILGYGAGVVSDPLLATGVHNTYVQQALYYGIPLGLLSSTALWLLAARFLFWPTVLRGVRVMAVAVGASVLIQLAIFLVETSFEATLPKTGFYFFAAFATAILTQMSREESHSLRGSTPQAPRQ